MIVKDYIAYQIATDRNYKVGEKYEFGKGFNFQAQRVLNHKQYDEKGRISEQGFKFLDGRNKVDEKELILKQSLTIEESDFVIRELATEYVRKEFYSDRPSRLRCMFLTDDKDACLTNLTKFYQKGHGKYFQAIAVKLNGNIFVSKDEVMPRSGLSFGEYMELAHKYWSQNQNSNQKINEILFEGMAEIVDIMADYTKV